MKFFLITLIFFTQHLSAARTCKDYITDEWPDSRYLVRIIANGNIVIDNKTGLMWKQCSEGLSGSDCTTGEINHSNWDVATNINQGYAGFNDWRLPNSRELRSIATLNCYNPAINENVFPNTSSENYWTSSPVNTGSSVGYSACIDFYLGIDTGRIRVSTNFVSNMNTRIRLVRTIE